MTTPKPSVTREDDIEWVRQALDYCIATGKPPTFAMKDAFERGLVAHREAAVRQERERIAAWMRVTPRAGDFLLKLGSSQDIARMADAIERADHAKGAE